MTEYGRGQAPEPWHPADPLYGDPGWTGEQQVPQHYPQAHPQQPQYPGRPYPDQPYPGGQYPDQQYPGQQYQNVQYQDPQYQAHPQAPQFQQQPPQFQQAPQFQQQSPQFQQQVPQGQQPYAGQQQPYDTQSGHFQTPTPAPPQAPYAGDPYGAGPDPYPQQQATAYPGETADGYGTEEAYPPPEPPGRRRPASEWQVDGEDADPAAEDRARDGDDGGDDADDDGTPPGARRSARGKGGDGGKDGEGKTKKRKGRNGVACLFVALVLVGGVGGVGYYGYSFLQDRFGAPEDYTGEGGDPVDVEIKAGANLTDMAVALKEAGVVKSVQAFVDAANADPKSKLIQPGLYPLKKGMSARSALELMSDPTKLNVLTIPEGWRNVQIYKEIDKRLRKPDGTTAEIAKKEFKTFGLPAWANNSKDIKDPLEGFLWPARYDLGKDSTPQSLLKQMVAKANEAYTEEDVQGQAAKLGLENPLQVVSLASLVQAEGNNKPDFDKIARVIYNRLDPDNTETYGLLDFDSTINYMKGQSTLDVGSVDKLRTLNDPYNTYKIKGLPPGPIGNPGQEALHSALNPEPGPWFYFVSLEKRTLFATTNEEHNQNRAEYEKERQEKKQ
ncbi:endolytic transglycosylase MltG [Streptomyces sp. NPDC048603]|uniref:endolytic transglycosylase MltG n=1 Tax=Streptomyces sp. NPDC048603 TaxID=3365577 RepID=UPI0037206FC1